MAVEDPLEFSRCYDAWQARHRNALNRWWNTITRDPAAALYSETAFTAEQATMLFGAAPFNKLKDAFVTALTKKAKEYGVDKVVQNSGINRVASSARNACNNVRSKLSSEFSFISSQQNPPNKNIETRNVSKKDILTKNNISLEELRSDFSLTKKLQLNSSNKNIISKLQNISKDLKINLGDFTCKEKVSLEEALSLGYNWVGDKGRTVNGIDGWIFESSTPDYIIQKIFRFPAIKKKGRHIGKIVANFEERIRYNVNKKFTKIKNGHLIIQD